MLSQDYFLPIRKSPILSRFLLVFLFLFAFSSLASSQDVRTYHNNNARQGLYPKETALTPANVNSALFGKLFTIPVDGKVDAQPLYLSSVPIPANGTHNLLIVATEHGTLYAFEADTGATIWHITTLKAGETTSDTRGCGQVSPEIGITSTPVISRPPGSNGVIYAVAMSKDASGHHHQRLHALDATTGNELFNGPMEIEAKYPGSGDNTSGGFVVFDPAQYKERAGLLLSGGAVYLAWASHCDIRPYTGWIMSYNASTLAQTSVLNVTPNGNDGAIWGAGAGMAADAGGNIYFLDGNGVFDTNLNSAGFPSNGNFGNAFLKLSTMGGLSVADYFEMKNGVSESNDDVDLGSGGTLLLPAMKDSLGHKRLLAVGAGKDSNLYVVDRTSMGKFNPKSNNIYQQLSRALPGGIWSTPVYFSDKLYYGPVGQPILAFQFSNARLLTAPVAHTVNTFPYPGASPSVSSNGALNGIVWATENSVPAVLHAYDATTLVELYNSSQAANSRDHFGSGNKFITLTIARGKVYVGTQNGVGVFGLLPAAAAIAGPVEKANSASAGD